MTRQELYNQISPCGAISYLALVYLVQNVQMINESVKVTLLERLSNNNGRFSQSDWLLFFSQVSFLPGAPININTVLEWITGKCNLTAVELRTILEYLVFLDGSEGTYLLAENGQILIKE